MVNDTEYKLNLNLDFSESPPEVPALCALCFDYIEGAHYVLSVADSEYQYIYDKSCWEQLLAIGIKMYQSLEAKRTERHN